jgi:disulfide bond formation protein DsbB
MMHRLAERPYLAPLAVVAVSLAALGTAFASEIWGGLEPCVLCIYQRYVYGAAIAVGLVTAGLMTGGLVRWPGLGRLGMALAALVFLAGAGTAFFHVGVEQLWWQGTAACHGPVLDPELSLEELAEAMMNTRFVPCDQIPWSLFGISMAGYNALASLGLAAASLWAAWRTGTP